MIVSINKLLIITKDQKQSSLRVAVVRLFNKIVEKCPKSRSFQYHALLQLVTLLRILRNVLVVASERNLVIYSNFPRKKDSQKNVRAFSLKRLSRDSFNGVDHSHCFYFKQLAGSSGIWLRYTTNRFLMSSTKIGKLCHLQTSGGLFSESFNLIIYQNFRKGEGIFSPIIFRQ